MDFFLDMFTSVGSLVCNRPLTHHSSSPSSLNSSEFPSFHISKFNLCDFQDISTASYVTEMVWEHRSASAEHFHWQHVAAVRLHFQVRRFFFRSSDSCVLSPCCVSKSVQRRGVHAGGCGLWGGVGPRGAAGVVRLQQWELLGRCGSPQAQLEHSFPHRAGLWPKPRQDQVVRGRKAECVRWDCVHF